MKTTRPEGPSAFRDSDYDPATDPSIIRDTIRSRPKYFDGQFLTARDLNREQQYLLARQADFARALGFGVVEGLRVSGEEGGHILIVTAGAGVTPSGQVVQLPESREVDLGAIELMRELSARFGLTQQPQVPFESLDGLFVLGLREVEFTANPVPVFPATLSGRDKLRDGDIVEASAFTLVPYESGAVEENVPARAIARVAREIFHEGRGATSREGVLPLAMLRLRGGHIVWMDEFLVRRDAGDDDRFGFGFAPRALAEAHFHHFHARVELTPPGPSAARDHFEILPPGGPLPHGVVDTKQLTQTFFPPEAKVDIALFPEDELELLMEESLQLPPIDLSLKPEDNDALAILVLALVPRSKLDDDLALVAPLSLAAAHAPGRGARIFDAYSRLQLLGGVDPDNEAAAIAKREADAKADAEAMLTSAAWTGALANGQARLWYVRRRNITPPGDIAPIPVATLALRGEEELLKKRIDEMEDEINELRKEVQVLRAEKDGQPEPPKEETMSEKQELKMLKQMREFGIFEPYWIIRTLSTTQAAALLAATAGDIVNKPVEGSQNELSRIFESIGEQAGLRANDGSDALRSGLEKGIVFDLRTVQSGIANAKVGRKENAAADDAAGELVKLLTESEALGAYIVISSVATLRARTVLDAMMLRELRDSSGDGKSRVRILLSGLMPRVAAADGTTFEAGDLEQHANDIEGIGNLILRLRDSQGTLFADAVRTISHGGESVDPAKDAVVSKRAGAALAERTRLLEKAESAERKLAGIREKNSEEARALKQPRVSIEEKARISAGLKERAALEESLKSELAASRAELRRLGAGSELQPRRDTKGGTK